MSDTTLVHPRTEAAPGPTRRAVAWKGWLGLILPVMLAILLEIGVSAGWLEGRFTPPPSKIAATLHELVASGEWFRHALATGWRVALGFLFGAGAGILLGTLSGALPLIRRLIDPTIQALRAVPSIAWVPLFILWFGIFETSKITLIAVGVFFPVYLGVLGAVLSIDRKVIEVGRVFRLSKLETGRRILLPATLPALVDLLARGPRPRLDVRRRGRDHGCQRRSRLPPRRRTAGGAIRSDRRGDPVLRAARLPHRCAAGRGDPALSALAR